MRSIPESLKAKMRLLSQTKANNADPRLDAIISRHVIPIQEHKMWQTSKVADFSGRVSIAVPRPDHRRTPEQILVGGIDNGVIKIYSAKFDGINAPELWSKILELSDAVDFSIAYLGKFKSYKKGTEFYTVGEYPWIFWIDPSGALYAQKWDDVSTRATLGLNVTSCSASMGINSVQGEWGYGLMVAWTTVIGAVFYAQLDVELGTWNDAITISQAPDNAVEVVLNRVADARMILLVKDSSGATTAMFFRSIAISLSNYEQVVMDPPKVTASVMSVTYHDHKTDDERVELTSIDPAAELFSILPPAIRSVVNIDDGAGNFGRYIVVEFRERVYGFEPGGFVLKDSSNASFICLAITRLEGSLNKLLLEIQDFNNAKAECTVVYTPGTLQGDTALAEALSHAFMPTGLIPVAVDPPVVVSLINIEEVDPNA